MNVFGDYQGLLIYYITLCCLCLVEKEKDKKSKTLLNKSGETKIAGKINKSKTLDILLTYHTNFRWFLNRQRREKWSILNRTEVRNSNKSRGHLYNLPNGSKHHRIVSKRTTKQEIQKKRLINIPLNSKASISLCMHNNKFTLCGQNRPVDDAHM